MRVLRPHANRRLATRQLIALIAAAAAITVIALAVVMTRDFERIERHYADIAAAKRDGILIAGDDDALPGHGWLPQGLPSGVTDIHLAYDLDTSETCGCARFAAKDTESIRTWLRAATDIDSGRATASATAIATAAAAAAAGAAADAARNPLPASGLVAPSRRAAIPVRMCSRLAPCQSLAASADATALAAASINLPAADATRVATLREETGHALHVVVDWTHGQLLFVRADR